MSCKYVIGLATLAASCLASAEPARSPAGVTERIFESVEKITQLVGLSKPATKAPVTLGEHRCSFQHYTFTSQTVPAYQYTITTPICGAFFARVTSYPEQPEADFSIDGYPAQYSGGITPGEFLALYIDQHRADISFEHKSGVSLDDYLPHIEIHKALAK